MLKRKIMNKIQEWYDDKDKKALLIRGLRQIGKTYSAMQFAKEHYKNVVYINFKNNSSMKEIFDGDLIVNRITLDISAKMPEANFESNETVIIFDEIQECQNARASLKVFVEDGRYDVIATGSLLGIKGYNKKGSKGIPIGYEKMLHMYPLDFEEFLWAKGVKDDVIDIVKQCFKEKKQISPAIHTSFIRYFKEYICIGGLPEVVKTFIEKNDMNKVYDMQRDLIEEYKDDFGKHLDENENEKVDKTLLARINRVFDSIPSQLAKENKKFQFSKIERKGRLENYEASIAWLCDYGLINPCYNLSNLETPLEGNKIDNIFKLYFADSGLFIAMLERGTAGEILNGDMNIYKGAIYENIIADAFSKLGRKLYYYHKDSGLEIDFITKYDNEVTLIEVKSKSGKTKSAKTILENFDKYKVKKCIKFGESNIGYIGDKLTLPYYLAFLLEE